jgi:predicted nucleic acid-binding protein
LTPKTIGVDSSVIVKWFKMGEDKEELALKLRSDVFSGRMVVMSPELMPLEVCRALVKVGYPPGKVAEAYSTLEDMDRLGFLEIVPVTGNIRMAVDLLQVMNLYVVDAINLAASISSSVDLVTEDRHLKRKRVREHAEKHGVRILGLEELYPST